MSVSLAEPLVSHNGQVLCYALGGGLGHLTRMRAALHTLGYAERNAHIMSPVEHVNDARIVGMAHPIIVPRGLQRDPDGLRAWVGSVVERIKPALLIVDAFPAGILGELCDAPFLGSIPSVHLARRLRWASYGTLLNGDPPQLGHVYRLEELEQEHENFLRINSDTTESLELADPPCRLSEREQRVVDALREGPRPLWVVVHSGSSREVMALVGMAGAQAGSVAASDRRDEPPAGVGQPRIVVAAPGIKLQGVECIDLYPASSLFPICDRIITGGGFNAMRQTASVRERHFAYPFPRRFDDQSWRIREAMR